MNNQSHGPLGFDRDRERELEEQQHRQRALQAQDDLAHREREHKERQERDRQHREQYQPPPHQASTGGIQIHQPVASRLPSAIHSPSGLLANHGGAAPLGAPNGPGNAFGGPLHCEANRQSHHTQNVAGQLQQQQQGFGPAIVPCANPVMFNPAHQAAQLEAASRFMAGPANHQGHQPGVPALGQGGQQPILNDALSYLDQVKVQFSEQPDVYNRFLDIMKDFKSQAIDTPGVINRVSELFAGHPNLIQGFNTFLPPGYRIECGAGDNPNTIRVTTPMGTTVQSIAGAGRALQDCAMPPNSVAGGYYNQQRPGNWTQIHHTVESPEASFSPVIGPTTTYNPSSNNPFDAAAAAAHQQQQRGVSQLTNAVATLGHPPRNTQTPTPGGQSSMNGGNQQGLEKRGPVEFNHAISYVNKIKNRFQDKPEIYKQFLEILQTYQRESKPIQDVYAQVTTLFSTAPDLLEDFKQFLPESAAQAKVAAAKLAAEEASQNQMSSLHNRDEKKAPPMTHFAVPPSVSKQDSVNNKKRPRNNGGQIGSSSQANAIPESNMRGLPQGSNSKRQKIGQNKPADAPEIAPTLTPGMLQPLQSPAPSGASNDELAFFDRVKKTISNKTSMNEFLKLCNMFSQDLIDRQELISKVSVFVGSNSEQMNWLKSFLNYKEGPVIIDNQPRAPSGRVALSNCRGLGPSYRLLPKRERLKPCSGRDEMCKQVLNDDWASHPTWASEDSGFVAHRKNTFEESLHRIEEERHDYDFGIEANARVIGLLEPIAQTLLSMIPEDRANFRMPIGQGGHSQAIYKRVLKKIYGERGVEVVADLFKDPCAVLPVVLARLKSKDEEWRFAQREWNKIWGFQTYNMYLRSLDHQGIQVKQSDKKHFSAKHLVDAIKTKHEELKRQKSLRGRTPKYQYLWTFEDKAILLDVLHLMVMYVVGASQHNNPERVRIREFFTKFIPVFFDLSDDQVQEAVRDIERNTPDDDSEDVAPVELPNGGRGRRTANGNKKNDLRRAVIDKKNNPNGRGRKDDSTTGSKESTPDVDSVGEDDGIDGADDRAVTEVASGNWADVATPIHPHSNRDMDFSADESFPRESFKFWTNQTLFVFMSLIQTLYERLKDIKDSEEEARQETERLHREKAASDINLINRKDDYYSDLNGESYYHRTIQLIEDFITGDVDEVQYQAFLRPYYLMKGWRIYTIQDFLKHLCRLGAICSSVDPKEKTVDLLTLFYQSRASDEFTFNSEINMRKQAEKYIRDGEMFLIQWHPLRKQALVRWILRDETTFNLDEMEHKERWQYYISSYLRIEPTEGVPRNRLHKTVLTRNIPTGDAEFDGSIRRRPLSWYENLTLRVCVNTYKIIYRESGSEFCIFTDKPLGTIPGSTDQHFARERLSKVEAIRTERFKEKFEMNNAWMKGRDRDEVANVNNEFRQWMENGILPGSSPAVAAPVVTASGDVEMT